MTEQIGVFKLHTCGVPVESKPPVIIFLSGFPDPASTWDALGMLFETDYHVVKLAYPFMDEPLPANYYWGCSVYKVRDDLLRVVQHYRETYACSQIHLVAHDWGAAAAILYAQEYPTTLTKLVFVDIAPFHILELGARGMFTFISYQSFLALCFVLSRILPRTSWWFSSFVSLYPWKSTIFSPGDFGDVSRVQPDQCYPYLQALWLLFVSGFNLSLFQDWGGVKGILFVYGKRKNIFFHGPRIIEHLNSTAGCRQVGYDNVGHWVQEESPQQLATDIRAFLIE